jgi:phage tail tape-measure protein
MTLEKVIEEMKHLVDDSGRKIEKHGLNRVLLTEGWYTMDQLKSVINLMERQNAHIMESMGVTK